MLTSFDILLKDLKKSSQKTIALAWGHFEETLLAIKKAQSEGIARAIIFGNANQGKKLIEELGMDANLNDFLDAKDEKEAAKMAVMAVKNGDADIVMKGLCSTSSLLKAVLNKNDGLRGKSVLSHIGIFEVASYHKLLIMTDPAMNIAPDLNDKIGILENAVDAAHMMGIELPKVAVITAVENVNPGKMPATEDAALLTIMNKRNQIKGCIVDGPLALDLAFSKEACEIKGLKTEVGGDCDIAVFPNIEAGNVFYKSLTKFANARSAGIIVGASAPIVLTSRADTEDSKFLSIAVALKISA